MVTQIAFADQGYVCMGWHECGDNRRVASSFAQVSAKADGSVVGATADKPLLGPMLIRTFPGVECSGSFRLAQARVKFDALATIFDPTDQEANSIEPHETLELLVLMTRRSRYDYWDMRTRVALLIFATSALAGAQAVPTSSELADAMDKAYKALPAFKCEVDDKVTILGKPAIPAGEFGDARLGWGFASGSRTATVVHKGGKLKLDLRTPDDGSIQRARIILVDGQAVTYADPDMTLATVMDRSAGRSVLDVPSALAGYLVVSGDPFATMVRGLKGTVTRKDGLISYDFQFNQTKGNLMIDPDNGYQVTQSTLGDDTRKVIEWAQVGGTRLPAYVVSESGNFYGAKRRIAERMTYDTEVSDEMLQIKWMEGAMITNDIEQKVYQVKSGNLEVVGTGAVPAGGSNLGKTLGGAALLVLFIGTSLVLAKRKLDSMPPEHVEADCEAVESLSDKP